VFIANITYQFILELDAMTHPWISGATYHDSEMRSVNEVPWDAIAFNPLHEGQKQSTGSSV
jgi:hypothetical protein